MGSARELLRAAAGVLAEAGVPTPQVDAELLLAHVTGRHRALLRLSGCAIRAEDRARFEELVRTRARRVPVQHLTGRAPFRHLELAVGPGVFIPRPETELIVDEVIRFARDRALEARLAAKDAADDGLLVVDLCTGSAALALSIATEIPHSHVLAVEFSADALAWAERNLTENGPLLAAADSVVELLAADATRAASSGGPLMAHRGLVDVVVTNPPYVPQMAIPREPEVRDHDPAMALYGGPDGLDMIRPLAEQAAVLLRPGGLLLVEHSDVQGGDAGDSGVPGVLLAQRERTDPGAQRDPARGPVTGMPSPWQDVADHPDLAGRPRHTSATRRPTAPAR